MKTKWRYPNIYITGEKYFIKRNTLSWFSRILRKISLNILYIYRKRVTNQTNVMKWVKKCSTNGGYEGVQNKEGGE